MIFPDEVTRYLINFRYAFNLRKPILIGRLVKTFLSIIVLKQRPLRYVDFAVDYRCNLKCEHCFDTALIKNKESRRMQPDDYARVAAEARKLGANSLSFQGGEPFLYKDLEKIIKACQPYKSTISITTNGTMLDREKIRHWKKIGVDILTISLDSCIPEEHDNFRGIKGTFDKTMNTIKTALEEGIHVTIGTTVSHHNIRSRGVKEIIRLSRELKVILCFALAAPAGNWSNNEDILLTKEDMEYIKELSRTNPYVRTDFEANYVHKGCGAIKEILYLTPYGDVLPCPFIHISFGNVLEESISTIRDRALKNKYFKDYYPRCLCSEDKEFIEKYLPKASETQPLPVNHKNVFG